VRNKINAMKHIVKEDGKVVEREEETLVVVSNYFTSLFTSTAGSRMEELIEHVPARVTPAMNELLMVEFTTAEIKAALDGIGDLKAPKPYELSAIFFKKYWSLIGEQVVERY
jgi:hypothetical protein